MSLDWVWCSSGMMIKSTDKKCIKSIQLGRHCGERWSQVKVSILKSSYLLFLNQTYFLPGLTGLPKTLSFVFSKTILPRKHIKRDTRGTGLSDKYSYLLRAIRDSSTEKEKKSFSKIKNTNAFRNEESWKNNRKSARRESSLSYLK